MRPAFAWLRRDESAWQARAIPFRSFFEDEDENEEDEDEDPTSSDFGAAGENEPLCPVRLIERGVSGFWDLMGVYEKLNEFVCGLKKRRFVGECEDFI